VTCNCLLCKDPPTDSLSLSLEDKCIPACAVSQSIITDQLHGAVFHQKLTAPRLVKKFHVSNGSYHHGRARPQVTEGRVGLQTRRVAASVLNKQSRTTDNRWSSGYDTGRGTNK
jgi:hypothetical protein